MRRNNECSKSMTQIFISCGSFRMTHHAILMAIPYVERFVKTCMTTGQAEVVDGDRQSDRNHTAYRS